MKYVKPLVATILMFTLSQVSAVPVFNASNGHYYDAVAGALNWNDASAAAQSIEHNGLYGHLVTITSAAESDFIINNLPSSYGTSSGFGYWIGAREYGNGPFEWVTGEAFSYTNWSTGEPNGSSSPDEGIHFYGYGTGGKWNDASATGYAFPGFIVEWDAYSTSVPEPVSLLLIGLGMIGLGFRRKNSRSSLA